MDLASFGTGLAGVVFAATSFVYNLRRNVKQDAAHVAALAKQAEASASALQAEANDRERQLGEIRAETKRRDTEVALLQAESERRNEELALLREQINFLRDQRAKADRDHAERIKVAWESSSIPPPNITLAQGDEVHAAFVDNASDQPIRDVRAGIKFSRLAGDRYNDADANGINIRRTGGLTVGEQQLKQNNRATVVRPGDEQVFLFGFSARAHPGAQLAVRFVDRAGVAWQIDPDFTLKPLVEDEWMY
jgi:hypothetical protein